MNKKNKILLTIFVTLIIIDQITKYLFSQTTINLGILILRPVTNTGISFGMFQGNNTLFIIITTIIIITLILLRKEFKNTQEYLTLIIAGATGNLIDRITHGHVIDFIDFRIFPVFNIADTIIFIGVAGIIIYETKQLIKQQKTKN